MLAVVADPSPALVLPSRPFTDATARVHAWRGRCIDSFTRAEAAVTECLVAMAAVKGRGETVTLQQLIGQRLDALAAAIGKDGPFAAEGGKAVRVLGELREQIELRIMLCHGTFNVTLDVKGEWTVVMRLVALRSAQVHRGTMALSESEAEARRAEVARVTQSLCSRLEHVRTALA